MKKKTSVSEMITKVIDLLSLAEAQYVICEEIYARGIELDFSFPHRAFLLLVANTSFEDAVMALHTLLCSTATDDLLLSRVLKESLAENDGQPDPLVTDEYKNELLSSLIRDYPFGHYMTYPSLSQLGGGYQADQLRKFGSTIKHGGEEDLKLLKAQFEAKNFHRARHEHMAHKNIHSSNPGANALGVVSSATMEDFKEILVKLRVLASLWFNCSFGNAYANSVVDARALLSKLLPDAPKKT